MQQILHLHEKLLEQLDAEKIKYTSDWLVPDKYPYVKVEIPSGDHTLRYEVFLYFLEPKTLRDLFDVPNSFHILQIAFHTNVDVAQESLRDVLLLLQMINKNIALPGFFFDDEAHQIAYRYAFPFNNEQTTTVLYLVRDLLDIYLEPVTQVSSGKTNLRELLDMADIAISDNLKM